MTAHGDGIALREPPSTDRIFGLALRPVPKAGDVLAAKRSARADVYTINIVSGGDDRKVSRYSEAIDRVSDLARELQVDGWFTCDHIHYARIATFRQHVRSGKDSCVQTS